MEKMRHTTIVLLTILLVIIILAILRNIPTIAPYNPYNEGGKGYSWILRSYDVEIVSIKRSIEGLQVKNSILLVPLTRPLENKSITNIIEYVKSGGEVLILDEKGYSNELLFKITNGEVNVGNYTVLDEISKYKDRDEPVIKAIIDNHSYRVVTYKPSYIMLSLKIKSNISVIGYTSNYSYIDYYADNIYDLGEEMGSFPIIIKINYGRGEIMIVSDLDIFTNKYHTLEDNSLFFKTIVGYRRILLVKDYIPYTPLDDLKGFFKYSSMISTNKYLNISIQILIYIALFSILEFIKPSHYKGIIHSRIWMISAILLLMNFAAFMILYVKIRDLSLLLPLIPLPLISLVRVRDYTRYFLFIVPLMIYSLQEPMLSILVFISGLIIPFGYVSRNNYSRYFIFGPSIIEYLYYISMILILTIFYTGLFYVLIALILPALIYSSTAHFILRNTIIESIQYSRRITITKDNIVKIKYRSSMNKSKLLIRINGEYKGIYELVNSGEAIISLKPSHTGLNRNILEFIVFDPNLFSYISLGSETIEYYVLPETSLLLRGIKEKLFRSRELLRIIEPIRIKYRRESPGKGLLGDLVRELVRLLESVNKRIKTIYYGFGSKSRIGEYYGSREYVPGDEPRSIHWKKSLNIGFLVVKEFESSIKKPPRRSFTRRFAEPVIIVDLTYSSHRELDKILYKLLYQLLRITSLNPFIKIHLVIHSSDTIYINGKVIDVLYSILSAFEKIIPKIIYEYESRNLSVKDDILVSNSFTSRALRAIRESIRKYIMSNIRILAEEGIDPPRTIILVYGLSSVRRNKQLYNVLVNNNYNAVEIGDDIVSDLNKLVKSIGAGIS